MLCSSLTAVSAAETGNKKLESTVGFLEFLGILEDYDIEMIQDGRPVTRAKFCSMFKDFIGDDGTCDTLYYHDVPRDHWAFSDIGVLTEKGIISGVGNGYFNPNEAMTKDAAYKMFVSILGLKVQAEATGGYPNGYFSVAQAVGLLDGIRGGAELMETDMLYLFYNALTCNTGTFEYSGGQTIYKIDEDKTMMSELYDMYIEKGVVTAANGADIYGQVSFDDEYVVIDDKKYLTDIDLFEYLGQKIEFVYYYDESDSEEPVIKYVMSARDSDVVNLEITPDSIFDPSAMTITYRGEGAANKTYKLSSGLMMIYNGVFYEGNIKDILDNDRYTLKLIENADQQGYDVAIVWEYENYVISSIDSANMRIYDRITQGKNISLNPDDYTSLKIYLAGAEKDFSILTPDQVLSVYRSKDGSRVKAYVTTTVINGGVDSIDAVDNILIVDGEEYFFKTALANTYRIGEEVALYLDKDGLIADIRKNTTDMQPGYFFDFKLNENEDTANIRLLKSDGQMELIALREKVNIDGITLKEYSDMKTAIGEDPQLILYQVDSEGKIKTIDTIAAGARNINDELIKTVNSTRFEYRWAGKFGTSFYINDSSVLFVVPSDITKDNYKERKDELFVTKKSDIRGDAYYTAEAYGPKSKKLGAEQIVVLTDYTGNTTTGDSLPILVERITRVLNEDDEIVECIVGFRGSAAVEIECDKDYSPSADISTGDVVIPAIGRDGLIKSCEVKFDYDALESTWPASTATYNARYNAGTVQERNEDYISLKKNTGAEEIFKIGTAPVIIYDANMPGDHIRVGSVDDILTYEMVGNNCDIGVIFDYSLATKVLILYKR